MMIGRVYIGFIKESPACWSWFAGKMSCGCRLLDLGPLYFTFYDKTCKCAACKQHECICTSTTETE